MYIVIIGCGRLGSTLARELSSEGHDISIIDNDKGNLDRLGSGFNGQRINGVEFDNDVLLDAGIDKADIFLAVTADDNTNIMAAQIARDIFGVTRVVARVCEPSKEFIYRKLGIEIVQPVQLAEEVIRNTILEEDSKILLVLDNDMEVVEIPVSKNRYKKTSYIERTYECIISAIYRNGCFLIPDKEDELRENDKILCTIKNKNRERLISALAGETLI